MYAWQPNLAGSFQLEGVAFGSAWQAYLSTEENSLGGAVLYRLDMDMNTFSGEPADQTAIHIFPQPASDVLTIVCPVPFTAYLLHAQGRLVHHQQTAEMNLRKLPRGTYQLIVVTEKGERWARRVLVQ